MKFLFSLNPNQASNWLDKLLWTFNRVEHWLQNHHSLRPQEAGPPRIELCETCAQANLKLLEKHLNVYNVQAAVDARDKIQTDGNLLNMEKQMKNTKIVEALNVVKKLPAPDKQMERNK